MDGLLLAKIMPPQRGGMLDRPRIADKIAGTGGCKVAFLTAPAGYGKTVAMLQAAQAMERKLAWCQLDVYDNDPVVFLRYLAASLEQARAGFGAQVLPLLGGGAAGRQRLFVTAFVRELSRHEMVPLLVALDDYHVITNSFPGVEFGFWGLSLELQGRLSEARIKAEAALAIAEPQAGLALAVCRAVGATVFVQTGSMAKGKEMLAAAAIEALTEIGFNKGLAHACAFQSWLCAVEGKAAEAEAYAQRVLALAARI